MILETADRFDSDAAAWAATLPAGTAVAVGDEIDCGDDGTRRVVAVAPIVGVNEIINPRPNRYPSRPYAYDTSSLGGAPGIALDRESTGWDEADLGSYPDWTPGRLVIVLMRSNPDARALKGETK